MSKLHQPQKEIEALFERYLTAWNGRDFRAIAECFSEPAFFITPDMDISVPDHSTLVAMLQKMFAGFEADGFSHTEVGEISARPCAERVTIVDVKSISRLRKDGSLIEVIDGHYVARRTDDGWKFATVVVCVPGWEG